MITKLVELAWFSATLIAILWNTKHFPDLKHELYCTFLLGLYFVMFLWGQNA